MKPLHLHTTSLALGPCPKCSLSLATVVDLSDAIGRNGSALIECAQFQLRFAAAETHTDCDGVFPPPYYLTNDAIAQSIEPATKKRAPFAEALDTVPLHLPREHRITLALERMAGRAREVNPIVDDNEIYALRNLLEDMRVRSDKAGSTYLPTAQAVLERLIDGRRKP
jgi:hypothetical protein